MVSPPLGKCGQPPAVVVQRLAAMAALSVWHNPTRFARLLLPCGALFCRRSPPKARCRGEQCSPVGVWSARSHGPKADAVQGWRANDVRPYMLYIIKQPVLYCAVFITTRCHSRSCHSSYSFYYVCPAEERCSHINQFRALMNNMNDLNDLNTNFTLVTS